MRVHSLQNELLAVMAPGVDGLTGAELLMLGIGDESTGSPHGCATVKSPSAPSPERASVAVTAKKTANWQKSYYPIPRKFLNS